MFFRDFEKLSMGLVFVIQVKTYGQLLVDGVLEREKERRERSQVLEFKGKRISLLGRWL